MSNWILVKDELPPHGERVIFSADGVVGEGYVNTNNDWFKNGFDLKYMFNATVIAWMKLPEAYINKTCKNCLQAIGEDCGIDGHETSADCTCAWWESK